MKNSKGNKINIIFSSFLVIGYIICAYFFTMLAGQVAGTLGSLIQVLILLVFGLLLFYATRVGEGKQVKRFSLAVLLLVDLPSLYIILASQIPFFPFHSAIAPENAYAALGIASTPSILLMLACVALGYGLPYTFFSGYEIKDEEEVETAAEDAPVEGGIAEELAQTAAEATEEQESAEAEIEAEEPTEAAEETTEKEAE